MSWKPDYEDGTRMIRCLVSCRDANGVPTFFPMVVQCSEDEYNYGEHYEIALIAAMDGRYEGPHLVYDDDDLPVEVMDFLWRYYHGS